MAEPAGRRRPATVVRTTPADRAPGAFAVYRTIIASRLRSQTTYRLSFSLDVVGSVCFALLELLEVYLIFHNVERLGGLTFGASLLVFGFARTGFSLAEAVVGNLRRIQVLVRLGSLRPAGR